MKMRQQLRQRGRHLNPPYQFLVFVSRHKTRMNRKHLNQLLPIRN